MIARDRRRMKTPSEHLTVHCHPHPCLLPRTLPFRALNGTWLGACGVVAVNLIPFILLWVPVAVCSALLLSEGWYLTQLSQMVIAGTCSSVQKPGGTVGRAGTATALAITAIVIAADTATASVIIGSSIWAAMTFANWGHAFAYSPWFAHTLLDWTVRNYSDPPGELRGALREMRTSRTLYCFHPHGIATVGFSCNGCWNHAFHERASLPDDPPSTPEGRHTYRGTMFLVAASLREPSAIFKVVCDLSGRYESASKHNMLRHMREGRNLAIIPGGAQDATIMEYGKHRTAIKQRKGIVTTPPSPPLPHHPSLTTPLSVSCAGDALMLQGASDGGGVARSV